MESVRNICVLGWLVATLSLGAATITENLSNDPTARGWKTFGDNSLFAWNATNQNLAVTWDSSRSNSYFYLPLGTVLSKSDDFSFAFDLRLSDIAVGLSSNKPCTFQIAIGLLNSQSATKTNFYVGTGVSSAYGPRNLVEFDYFPSCGPIGATFASVVVSTNNQFQYGHNYPLELTPGDLFRIVMTYTASNQLLRTSATRNGTAFGLPPGNTLKDVSLAALPDFRLDALAVMSYGDAIQTGALQYWGSILAHGTVDNIVATFPDPPVMNFAGRKTNSLWQATFTSRTNWLYHLERSIDLETWLAASPTITGNGAVVTLQDTNPPLSRAFYRVKAQKP